MFDVLNNFSVTDYPKNRKIYAFWILLAEAVGGISGWLTRESFWKNIEATFLRLMQHPAREEKSCLVPISAPAEK